MRWFNFETKGVSLPWKEWKAAATDPEDLIKSMALGRRTYRFCMKEAGVPEEKEAELALMAFAHILHHTLDEMDEERWLELRWHLQEGWKQSELTLWEAPDRILHADLLMTQKEPLPRLLAIHQELEHVVRPELFRLLWCMLTSSGRRPGLRSLEMRSVEGGLLFPLMMLEQLSVQGVPAFFDEDEKEGMSYLRSCLHLGDRLSTDELLEALSFRRYHVQDAKIYLEPYLRSGGEWFTQKEIAAWRVSVTRSCSLLYAFRVMFLAAVSGESGPLRVLLPD
ncbi:MAG TPA: hypothetical protein VMW85_04850 [Methanomassiliicoccales archaeon]|nr:hypothetical protein [Methanomassiliicoccales archaeon]